MSRGPLRGCDPKKVLVGAAEVVDAARRFTGRGVSGTAAIRWPELMRFKRTFTDHDVITANMYSKSVLRTVAGGVAAANRNVDYFPSYESVMLTPLFYLPYLVLPYLAGAFAGAVWSHRQARRARILT